LRKIAQAGPTSGVQWLEEFASSLVEGDLSPKTVAGYRQDLELFRRWLASVQSADAALGSLSAIDLMSYRQHLSNVERLKPTTINRRMQALRKFCK
jgi:integrase/recombinase XerC